MVCNISKCSGLSLSSYAYHHGEDHNDDEVEEDGDGGGRFEKVQSFFVFIFLKGYNKNSLWFDPQVLLLLPLRVYHFSYYYSYTRVHSLFTKVSYYTSRSKVSISLSCSFYKTVYFTRKRKWKGLNEKISRIFAKEFSREITQSEKNLVSFLYLVIQAGRHIQTRQGQADITSCYIISQQTVEAKLMYQDTLNFTSKMRIAEAVTSERWVVVLRGTITDSFFSFSLFKYSYCKNYEEWVVRVAVVDEELYVESNFLK